MTLAERSVVKLTFYLLNQLSHAEDDDDDDNEFYDDNDNAVDDDLQALNQ